MNPKRLSRHSLVLVIILACLTPSLLKAQSGGFEHNTDRPGRDYRDIDLSRPDPSLCRDLCAGDPQCKAYTYVKPGVQGSSARCWLKTSIPDAVESDCCVSGVKGGEERPRGQIVGKALLQLVEVIPPKQYEASVWSIDPNGGRITYTHPNGSRAEYRWTLPPQQIGAEGFTITLTVSAQSLPRNRQYAGMDIRAGFDLDPPYTQVEITSEDARPESKSLTLKIKPQKNLSDIDYYIGTGASYGPGFNYRYRLIR
jgi:hypothetical protein